MEGVIKPRNQQQRLSSKSRPTPSLTRGTSPGSSHSTMSAARALLLFSYCSDEATPHYEARRGTADEATMVAVCS